MSPAAGHLTTPTVVGLPGLCENFRPTTSKSSPILRLLSSHWATSVVRTRVVGVANVGDSLYAGYARSSIEYITSLDAARSLDGRLARVDTVSGPPRPARAAAVPALPSRGRRVRPCGGRGGRCALGRRLPAARLLADGHHLQRRRRRRRRRWWCVGLRPSLAGSPRPADSSGGTRPPQTGGRGRRSAIGEGGPPSCRTMSTAGRHGGPTTQHHAVQLTCSSSSSNKLPRYRQPTAASLPPSSE